MHTMKTLPAFALAATLTLAGCAQYAHGYDFNEAVLPTAKARNLLGELVGLHMARLDPQRGSAPELIVSGRKRTSQSLLYSLGIRS